MWLPPHYRAGGEEQSWGQPRTHASHALLFLLLSSIMLVFLPCRRLRNTETFDGLLTWSTRRILTVTDIWNWSPQRILSSSLIWALGGNRYWRKFPEKGSLPCVYLFSLCLLDPKFPYVPRKWWICIPSNHKCSLCCYFSISEVRMHLQSQTWHSLTVASFWEHKIMDCLYMGGFLDSLAYNIHFHQGFPTDEREKHKSQNREIKSCHTP